MEYRTYDHDKKASGVLFRDMDSADYKPAQTGKQVAYLKDNCINQDVSDPYLLQLQKDSAKEDIRRFINHFSLYFIVRPMILCFPHHYQRDLCPSYHHPIPHRRYYRSFHELMMTLSNFLTELFP
jgi:hypothetical protein